MKLLDWVIIAAIVICTVLCIRRILRKKDGCSCGSCSSCASCGGKCGICAKDCNNE